MSQQSFIDYYELLQVSRNADKDTIERVFRHLAKRYHPDNTATGDAEVFSMLVDAYKVLSDPEKRAGYDVRHQQAYSQKWRQFVDASSAENGTSDEAIRHTILAMLYDTRRKDAVNPGLGIYHIEQLLDCPHNHLEFHMWYLKAKGWIERTETGCFAITVDGVDAVIQSGSHDLKQWLLPEHTGVDRQADDPDGD